MKVISSTFVTMIFLRLRQLKKRTAYLTGRPQMIIANFFSHPDCTVGCRFTLHQPLARVTDFNKLSSNILLSPSVGNFTLPRRNDLFNWHKDISFQIVCQCENYPKSICDDREIARRYWISNANLLAQNNLPLRLWQRRHIVQIQLSVPIIAMFNHKRAIADKHL